MIKHLRRKFNVFLYHWCRHKKILRYVHPLFWYADRIGIGIFYYGDEVIWIWPWRRTHPWQRWLSVMSEGSFQNLAAIRRFWDEYREACRKLPSDAPK